MRVTSDSIRELTSCTCIRAFAEARDWERRHNAKDLAVAMAAEVADVGILRFEMAHVLGVDLGREIVRKMRANERRYPVVKSQGNNLKSDEWI